MDRKIHHSPLNYFVRKHAKLGSVLVIIILVIVVYKLSNLDKDGLFRVDKSMLSISIVQEGAFSEVLNLRGSVEAKTSVFLDSVAGGTVEQKMATQGEYVQRGQPLVTFSNTALQLDLMSREAQVTEQLNFLRNTQMTMETNRLNLRRDLLEIDLKISHLERKEKQIKPMVANGTVAKDMLQTLEEDLQYFYARKQLTLERQQQEGSIRQVQLAQLEESANMLNRNLTFARKNLENLTVKSPVDGYLSEFNVERGESKKRGDRLGQIDIPDKYKLRVTLDEFYLNQVNIGMSANVDIEGSSYNLRVSKIDSQVENAQFSIEIELPEPSTDIKRGQSLNVALILGADQQNAVLLPRGQFYANTGGNWIFVLLPDKRFAERRAVHLGKKNRDYYQVLDGLSAGEQVVISSYSSFDRAKSLKLN